MKVRIKVGSQLIARFSCDKDPLIMLASVREIVVSALGSEFAVRLEVARGSIAVYITFLENNLSLCSIVEALSRQGGQLNFITDPDGQAGYITLVAAGSLTNHLTTSVSIYFSSCNLSQGLPFAHGQLEAMCTMHIQRVYYLSGLPAAGSFWSWFEPAKPACLRYAGFVTVPVTHGKRCCFDVAGAMLLVLCSKLCVSVVIKAMQTCLPCRDASFHLASGQQYHTP